MKLTTADVDGAAYDVALLDSPNDGLDYGLVYMPFDRYSVSIYMDRNAIADEILEYIDDFTLVENSD